MTTDKHSDPGGDTSPFNRTVQHDAKRAAILSQAAKLFNSKGSRATTLRDIAESLGLTKTSLYYYVKTKEDLIYQCYMAALEHHHNNLDEVEKKYDDPVERASGFFLHHFESWLAAQEGRTPHVAALLEIAALKGAHREEVEARYISMFKRLREYLRQGIAEGSLRQCEPTATTRAILGSVDWTFSWLQDLPREQVQTVGKEALDILAAVEPCATDPLLELAPILLEEIREIQSVCVLLTRWDARRADLIEQLEAWQVGLKVVLVSLGSRRPEDLPPHVEWVSARAVREGKVVVL